MPALRVGSGPAGTLCHFSHGRVGGLHRGLMSHDNATWYAAGETGRPRPLLTIDALAALLAVDRKTVYRLPIPYVVIGTRRRFRPEDVDAYLDEHRAVSVP